MSKTVRGSAPRSDHATRMGVRPFGLLTLVGLFAVFLDLPVAAQETGTVTGRVSSAGTGEPLNSVQMFIPGTGRGTLTSENGRYAILNVPVGTHTIRAERIGYAAQTREVQVAAGETVVADFQLQEMALGLDEIVVTGTAGAARRREIGNSISQLNVADFAEPVQDLDNLLQGRATGLSLQQTGGAVGSGGRIRLRGNVSATLSNQPLIYVDGVRARSEAYPKNVPPTGYAGRSTNTTASPLNDINPADIERIEVIKGPAATTLYGTEAAAGVIQIFTKSGAQGEPRWTLQVDQSALHVQNFGPTVGLRGESLRTPPQDRAYLEQFSEYYDGDESPHEAQMYMKPFLRTGYTGRYNLSVRGGTETLGYFVSGQLEDVTGVHLSEGAENYSVRGNVNFEAFEGLTVRWNSAYNRRHFDQVPNGGNAQGIHLNAQRRGQNYFNDGDPGTVMEILDTEMDQWIDHLTTGLTATYAPTGNFTNRLTVGYDLAAQESRNVRPFGFFFAPEGIMSNERWSESTLTADYVGSYSFDVTGDLGSTFSWGGQAVTTDTRTVHGQANEFPGPGRPTLSSGSVKLVFEDRIRVINAGFFGQNVFDYKDRYFLTTGVRVDGNSAFGDDLGLQVFPKVSGSYILSEEEWWNESLGSVKLRAAWGHAGRAPGAFDAVRTWDPIGFGGTPAFLPLNVGNPNLGPERTSEIEAGFESSHFDQRLDLDFTWYRQVTEDALFDVRQRPSEGFVGSQLENRGKILNTGIEFTGNFEAYSGQDWGVEVGTGLWTNKSEALDLGGAPPFSVGVNGWVIEGEPVPVMRGSCIRNPDEVAAPVIEENCNYGPNQPTLGITPNLSVRMPYEIRFFARGEYQGGNWMYSNFEGEAYARGIRWPTCFNAYPLIEAGNIDQMTAKERAICITANADREFAIMPVDFFKIRELTLTAPIPGMLLPRATNGQITLSARNIYRWTKDDLFGFTEPEASGDWNRDSSGSLGQVMILGATPPPAVFTASVRVNF